MKDIFIIWIAWQLMVCGMVVVDTSNKMLDGSYECPKDTKISKIWGALFPLVAFVPTNEIDEYCNKNL